MKKILAVCAFFISCATFAGPYGESGCGLGSLLFNDTKADHKSWWKQILSATTNATSGNQTFGMTSGTSNCDINAMSGGSKSAFIEANRNSLIAEISKGQGPTLNALLNLYGENNMNQAGIALKMNFNKIFPSFDVSANQIELNIQDVLTHNI